MTPSAVAAIDCDRPASAPRYAPFPLDPVRRAPQAAPRAAKAVPDIHSRGRRMTPHEVARILDLRQGGLSFSKIAAIVGCSTTTVHKYVDGSVVAGTLPKSPTADQRAARDATIRDRFNAGEHADLLAANYGLTKTRIYCILATFPRNTVFYPSTRRLPKDPSPLPFPRDLWDALAPAAAARSITPKALATRLLSILAADPDLLANVLDDDVPAKGVAE